MHTEFVDPEHLSPQELDRWLARGWYRMGQSLFTARYVVFDEVLRAAVWTRLDLQGYQFRKGLRRVLRKVDSRFRVEIDHAVLDDEREALYQRYRAVARGDRSPSLYDFLYGDSSLSIFDTWEVRVWDGDHLVAFSWFDVGERAIQSLIGVYEPELAEHSLGFFTMLAEIRFGMGSGRRWFYPGYILPGDPSMDYKLRIGEVEFLDLDTGKWRPWADFPTYVLPTQRLEAALETMRQILDSRGIPARQRLISWFDVAARQPALAACLSEPLVVECWPDRGGPTRLMITYDLERQLYTLLRCLKAEARRVDRDGNLLEPDPTLELWVVVDRLARHTQPQRLANDAARLGG